MSYLLRHGTRYLLRLLRSAYMKRCLPWMSMGSAVSFGTNVYVRCPHRVSVGDGVVFGSNIEINNAETSTLTIGSGSEIGSGTFLTINGNGRLVIGHNTKINKYNMVSCNNLICVGNYTMTAAFCHILDANHGMKRGEIMRRQHKLCHETHIGDDVWIGSNCVILAGSCIGKGVVVGAGSVVMGRLDNYGIYAGNPAVKKKERTD